MKLPVPSLDPAEWARRIGVSREAIEIHRSSDVIDLHVDTTVPMRVIGYDPVRRHRPWVPGSPFMGHVDLPRAREGGLTGMVWDIATNPLRRSHRRAEIARRNLERQVELFRRFPDEFRLVRTAADYRAARSAGCTAVWFSIQGGQALDHDLGAIEALPEGLLHRVTLVHLTPSRIGVPNSLPRRAGEGLTDFGRDFVRLLDEKRILVDLAHINRAGFFDAAAVHDPSLPLIVSHTGVAGVRPLWRNIDDEQIKRVADTGGTIGIIFHPPFVTRSRYTCLAARIVDHIEHVIHVAGDDFVSLGSDFDGMIILPRDMADVTELPRLTQEMLHRGWSAERIGKILGGNYLRVVEAIRP